ncbi:MAG: TRAP transporter large permease subunit, partial [Alphaproteobacteria bacterium]|nr:TRAP transporter large permease subunit [Alphaproteobacteria bacterium]
ATPTEAASIGAIGAIVLATLNRAFSYSVLLTVMRNTAVISAMVFGIVLGVSVFSLVFRGLGGEHMIEQLLTGTPGGAVGAILAVMVVMFVLGFFMDTLEIVLIVVPITAPTIIGMGIDGVWLGVMIGMNLQTAFLTPPVGFALFYMRGVAPPSITTMDIYRGVVPFVGLQIVGIALLWMVPELATWLPDVLFPEPVAAKGAPEQTPDSVLDKLLKPPAPTSSGSDPLLDRLLQGKD